MPCLLASPSCCVSVSQLSSSLRCNLLLTDTVPSEIYTLSLHDALPILSPGAGCGCRTTRSCARTALGIHAKKPLSISRRSEEHTSELQSRGHLVCRLLLEKKRTEHSTNLFEFQHEHPARSDLLRWPSDS